MKKTLLTLVAATTMLALNAQQTDSTLNNKVDTIKVGNYVIIKKNKPETDSIKHNKSITISSSTDDLLDITFGNRSKKNKSENVSTNWFIFDLGFANVIDNTNYATAQTGSYFNNKNGLVNASSFNLLNNKSSNFNIWFFMQKINVSKHKLNLKYGLGYEQFNFRYENNISYRNKPNNYVFNDTVNFTKNKLYANYLTIPFMVNYNSNPNSKKSFSVSAGISAGYLIAARNKQISAERGKEKTKGNFDLEPLKLSLVGEIGLGPIRVYGSYALNNMFKSSTGIQQAPFAFGIRFSRW